MIQRHRRGTGEAPWATSKLSQLSLAQAGPIDFAFKMEIRSSSKAQNSSCVDTRPLLDLIVLALQQLQPRGKVSWERVFLARVIDSSKNSNSVCLNNPSDSNISISKTFETSRLVPSHVSKRTHTRSQPDGHPHRACRFAAGGRPGEPR